MKAHQSLSALPESNRHQSALGFWWSHIKKHKVIYLIGGFGVVGTNISEVAIPLIFREILDDLQNNLEHHTHSLALLASVLGFQFACRVIWRRFMAQQTHVVSASMKARLWEKARYFDRSRLETDLNPGELMNVAAGDVGSARYIFGFTLVMIIDFVFLLLFAVSAMVSISPLMTLVTLVLLPALPFFLHKVARKEWKAHEEAQEQLSTLSEQVAQSIATVRLQRVSQSQGFWTRLLRESALRYQEKRWTVVQTELSFFPIISLFPLISYAVLISLGLHFVFLGTLSVGSFVAFQSLLFIIQDPLIEVGQVLSEWQRAMASLKRYKTTLEQPPSKIFLPKNRIHQVSPPPPLLVAENLSFSFSNSTRTLFSGLSFTLRSGERLGLKGPIGTGKSTLLDLVSGFQRSYTGSLRLLGHEVCDLSHEQLRELIGIVPQKPFLFANSIRNNLSLDRPLSDSEVFNLLACVELEEDIARFAKVYDTPLGEWGVNLSGGQKQRLTLARALVNPKPLLILDDCLSAVDTITEEKILRNLDRYLPNTTLLWVAHRESTLKLCTKMLELH